MARVASRLAVGIVSVLIVQALVRVSVAGEARPGEMQAPLRPSAAMTPQQARIACWREAGFAPNTPRRNYPATLQPQI
ncbi:hypothetical protein, partial [Acinetobacter baumannii]|uniref:hypothetical protein n=1 Tax=Acinetobacter baumannii TaxID=470 RepID=UPI0013D16FF5